MKKIKIAWRLGLLTLGSVLAMMVLVGVSLVQLRDQMEAERTRALRGAVDVVASQIAAYQQDLLSGRMSRDDMIARIREIIAKSRYDGNNYFFVYDWDGLNLAGARSSISRTVPAPEPSPIISPATASRSRCASGHSSGRFRT